MIITFNNKEHTYTVDGEIASISVTELLRKHGLAPDYSAVKDSVLEKKRQKGKAIHADLENVCNSNRYTPKTEEGKKFKAWANENLSGAIAEQTLAFRNGDIIIAGTADIMAIGKNGDTIIADHKNMAKVHKESVAWQISLYDYFARQLKSEEINGKPLNWHGATKFLCFQYDNGEMKTLELEPISDTEIERLLWAELNGETYKKPELELSGALQAKIEKAELAVISAEQVLAKAKAQAIALREELVKQMKEQKVKTFETDKLKITYVEPSVRNTVDTKILQQFYPMQYLNCLKKTTVKEQVKITIKGEKQNGKNDNTEGV